MGNGVVDAFGHLVLGQVGNGAVQGRGADERVDAWAAGVFHRLPAAVDVLVVGPGQTADHRVLRLLGYGRNGCEITLGGDGKARLDDVDAHFVQHSGDFQLFLKGHCGARGLLAIAQRRVKNQDAVLVCLVSHFVSL